MAGCITFLLIALVALAFILGIETTRIIVAIALALVVILLVWGRTKGAEFRARRADGSYARQYVYVEEGGGARELSPAELDYLNAEFEGGDLDAPHIKFRYKSLTPDGRMWGYLKRKKLPKQIEIRPAPVTTSSEPASWPPPTSQFEALLAHNSRIEIVRMGPGAPGDNATKHKS
jgi:hypothetical protein